MSTTSSIVSLNRPPAKPAVGDSIQPPGFAILVSPEWLVERISANIGDYFDTAPEATLGRPLSDLLGADAVHGLRNQLALLRAPEAVARLFSSSAGSSDRRFDLLIRLSGQRAVVEGSASGAIEHGDTVATVQALIERLAAIGDLPRLLENAARQLRALTGFDRIAVVRRRRDGSGEVAAQTARSLPPLDRPLSAEDYAALRSGPAVIGDCEAEPVALVPPGPLPEALLLAPSPPQRQRMRDMGCAAMLVLPLKVEAEEWGFLVAHHPHARHANAERQAAIELFAQMLGLLVEIAGLKAR